MSQHLEVTEESIVTIKLSREYADKLQASLGRALTSMDHLNSERYEQLVDKHTVDDLLALKTALWNLSWNRKS